METVKTKDRALEDGAEKLKQYIDRLESTKSYTSLSHACGDRESDATIHALKQKVAAAESFVESLKQE